MIAQSTIDKAADTPILDIIGSRVTLKKKGHNHIGLCPFHQEKTPSFTVSPDKGIYKCFGCGAGGSGITFLQEYEKLTFPEAVKSICDDHNIQIDYISNGQDDGSWKKTQDERKLLIQANHRMNQKFLDHPGNGSIGYEGRPWGPDVATLFEVGYSPDDPFYGGRITYPIYNHRSELVGFTARATGDRKPKHKNSAESVLFKKSQTLYGIHLAKTSINQQRTAILVEGPADVMALYATGITNVVASMGTAVSADQIRILKRYCDRIILMMDGDDAGKKATLTAHDLCLDQGIYTSVVVLPDDQDPCGLVESGQNITQMIKDRQDAIMYRTGLLFSVASTPHQVATAIKETASMLARIEDPTIRGQYTKDLAHTHKITIADLRAAVKNGQDQKPKLRTGPQLDSTQESDSIKYGFFERDNRYYFRVGSEGEGVFVPRGNFTIRSIMLIEGRERIIELTNVHNHKVRLTMPIDALVSLQKFTTYCEGQGNFIPDFTDVQLRKIKSKLFEHEMRCIKPEHLGYREESGCFLFSNGLLDPEGIFHATDEFGRAGHNNHNYFIPYFSKLTDSHITHPDERRFRWMESQARFESWAAVFHDVYGKNGMVAICYLLASLYSDHIYKTFDFSPMLFLFGKMGTGKSTMAFSMMSLFGQRQKEINLSGGSTPKAVHASFSQYCNGLVMLDEYKNHIKPYMLESLKSLYNRQGYKKKQFSNDNATDVTPILANAVVCGQELPTAEEALFSRFVILSFTDEPKDNENYYALKDAENKGLTSVLSEILKHRQLVVKNFKPEYDQLYSQYKHLVADKHLGQRGLMNTLIIAAMYKVLEPVLEMPFTFDHLMEFLMELALSQGEILGSSIEVQKFWQVVEHCIDKHVISDGEDIRQMEGDQVAIRLKSVHANYMEYYRRLYNTTGLGIRSLENYLKQEAAFIETRKSLRFTTSNTSAYIFDNKVLEESGINLFRSPLPT